MPSRATRGRLDKIGQLAQAVEEAAARGDSDRGRVSVRVAAAGAHRYRMVHHVAGPVGRARVGSRLWSSPKFTTLSNESRISPAPGPYATRAQHAPDRVRPGDETEQDFLRAPAVGRAAPGRAGRCARRSRGESRRCATGRRSPGGDDVRRSWRRGSRGACRRRIRAIEVCHPDVPSRRADACVTRRVCQ